MALGKSHDYINLLALPVCLYYTPKEFYIPFTLGYVLGTFFLSPDLDLPQSKPSKRWRKLKLVWRPYQSFSKHRGFSHIPLLGTLLRLSYLFLVFILLYFVLLGLTSKYAPHIKDLLLAFDPFNLLSNLAKREDAFYFALGVVISEAFHVALDILSTLMKKLKI
ncbi:MAG: DUF2227 family putative metal-binding protein [Aquificaceae bacterium]